jgi:hypothetical protein
MMTPKSRMYQHPVVEVVKEEEKKEEVLNIELSADKQTLNCEADKKFGLKIKVTNTGTMTSPALTLSHKY